MHEDTRTCRYCGEALRDGREESGFTGEGPDWSTLGGDFGCDRAPDTTDEVVGSHEPVPRPDPTRALPLLTVGELETRHRDAAGRPEFDVKVRHGLEVLTPADWSSIRAERGIGAEDEAPLQDGDEESELLPFGQDWIELRAGIGSEGEAVDQRAYDSAMIEAGDAARELFGPSARVYSEGRSAGWIYCTEGSTVAELEEADKAHEWVRSALEDLRRRTTCPPSEWGDDETAFEELDAAVREAEENAENYMDADELADELRRLSDFADRARTAVADFPRRLAWYWADRFCAARDEHLEALEAERRDAGRGRLADFGAAVLERMAEVPRRRRDFLEEVEALAFQHRLAFQGEEVTADED